jgi:hypothetical protein
MEEIAMFDTNKLELIRQNLQEWEKSCLSHSLKQLPEQKKEFITTSSEPIQRL